MQVHKNKYKLEKLVSEFKVKWLKIDINELYHKIDLIKSQIRDLNSNIKRSLDRNDILELINIQKYKIKRLVYSFNSNYKIKINNLTKDQPIYNNLSNYSNNRLNEKIDKVNNKWLINLSQTEIPENIAKVYN